MAIHESLDMARRTGSASDTVGRWIPVAGRVGSDYPWTITADLGDVESGSATVRVEASPTRGPDDVVTVYAFAARSAPIRDTATVTLSGYLERGFVRAVGNVDGVLSAGVTLGAPFFHVVADADRLEDQVRAWAQVARAAQRAERDLLDPYRRRESWGYALDMTHYQFPGDLREAIALQIEHRFQLWSLGRSQDPSSKVTLRQSTAVDREARFKVGRYGPLVHL